MALVTDAMSVWMERPRPSQPDSGEGGSQRQSPLTRSDGVTTLLRGLLGRGDEAGLGAHRQAKMTQM